MDLSIIIVNYNSINYLLDCLKSIKKSLIKCKFKYEVIVIDNASEKRDFSKIKEIMPLKIIFNKSNIGFAKACNQGIDKAIGEYILLLNPDTIVLDKSIEKLLNFIKEKKDIFAGGRLLNSDLTRQPSCGVFYNLLAVFFLLFLKGEKLGITKSSPFVSKKVDWVSAACLIARKKDFLKVGGFDEKVFLYMEDVDLLFRAKTKNLSCYFFPNASFIHYGAVISGRENSAVNIYSGLVYFYNKHYNRSANLILIFLLYLKAYLLIFIGLISFNSKLVKGYKLALKSIN